MTAVSMDGKALAARIEREIASQVATLKHKPGLGVVLVGDDPASAIYVRNKQRACERAGINSVKRQFPYDASEQEVLAAIDELNNDPAIDAILVQLPLPSHMSEERVLMRVREDKDVDSFHPASMGRLVRAPQRIAPCTPKGVIRLLDEYHIPLEGKDVVIIGRSAIVGRPLALMLIHRNATVTICHSRTIGISEHIARADIVIAATGMPGIVSKVKIGATVIDVGISRVDGRIVGDVDQSVATQASHMTPVPGGVGPMTIVMLLENTLERYQEHHAV